MKVLVFGNGYIGNAYKDSGVFPQIIVSRADITNINEVKDAVDRYRPDVIINAAGKTNLEWCRDNQDAAMRINALAPLNILKVAREHDAYFVHLGSGCIFEGTGLRGTGFSEQDAPTPQCFYAHTKVLADDALMKTGYHEILILRLRQPFSNRAGPRNLVTKLLTYEKLITSPNSMTYVNDLISATKFLIEKRECGIFNVCNTGTISPYDIAMLAKKLRGINKEFIPIAKAELDNLDHLGGREKRVDTIINGKKLEIAGFKMPNIHDRIMETLIHYEA